MKIISDKKDIVRAPLSLRKLRSTHVGLLYLMCRDAKYPKYW